MKIDGMEIVLFKLFLAALVGLILGLEREGKHKSLGLKTCVVISITSCLLTIVSVEFALNPYRGFTFTGADPMRLASQINMLCFIDDKIRKIPGIKRLELTKI